MTGKAKRGEEGSPKKDQLDLFVALPGDLPTHDQQEMMERPFFSLSKGKRLEPIDYRVRNGTTEILTVQAVADLLRHERHDLVRDVDEADAEYAARSELFGALLDHARHG